MISISQTKEVVIANVDKALKSMKSELANEESNARILNEYMVRHYTGSNGISDYSEENLRAAIWTLREALEFTIPPKAPRSVNPQSILNESNKERRAREQAEAEEKAAKAKKDEEDAEVHEALRQGERMVALAGTAAEYSHSRRAVARERMEMKWQQLLRQAPPQAAVKLLRAYWENNQDEIYSVRGTMQRLRQQ